MDQGQLKADFEAYLDGFSPNVQEINPETYAIAKADLLLKGEGQEAENMKYGSTLSNDGFPSHEFDFMLSNPPYGKSWKTDQERMGGKGDLKDPRFIVELGGDGEFSLVTRSSDGQLLRHLPGLRRDGGIQDLPQCRLRLLEGHRRAAP